jgi:hypothetical protein
MMGTDLFGTILEAIRSHTEVQRTYSLIISMQNEEFWLRSKSIKGKI